MRIKSVYWEITDVCNLHCKHCYNASSPNKHHFISLDTAARIINDLDKLGCQHVSISGGEPLLHPQITEILKLLFQKNITPLLITNATQLSDAFLSQISDTNLSFQISIESSNETENDYIRGHGNYRMLINSFELLKKKGLIGKVVLHQTPTAVNYKNVTELIGFAKELGCRSIGFSLWAPIGRSADHIDDFSMSTHETIEFMNMVNKAKLIYETDFFSIAKVGIVSKCFLCNDEITDITPYISNSGHVYCCSKFSDPQYAIGNIYQESLFNILSTSERIANVVQQAKHKMSACESCVLKGTCGRGCIAMATLRGNTNDGFCEIRKQRILTNLLSKSK